jgi:DNA-binding ferritin-like protein
MNIEIDALNKILSITQSVIDEIQSCHWNIKGPSFSPIHSDLGTIYDLLIGWQDTIAERIKANDPSYLVSKGKSEIVSPISNQSDIIDRTIMLLKQLALLVTSTLSKVNAVTANELQTLILVLDKWVWKFTNSK